MVLGNVEKVRFLALFLLFFLFSASGGALNAQLMEGYAGAFSNEAEAIPFEWYEVDNTYTLKLNGEWIFLGQNKGLVGDTYQLGFSGAYYYYPISNSVEPLRIQFVVVSLGEKAADHVLKIAFSPDQLVDTGKTVLARRSTDVLSKKVNTVVGYYKKGSSSEVFEYAYGADGKATNLNEMGDPILGEKEVLTINYCFDTSLPDFPENNACKYYYASNVEPVNAIPDGLMAFLEEAVKPPIKDEKLSEYKSLPPEQAVEVFPATGPTVVPAGLPSVVGVEVGDLPPKPLPVKEGVQGSFPSNGVQETGTSGVPMVPKSIISVVSVGEGQSIVREGELEVRVLVPVEVKASKLVVAGKELSKSLSDLVIVREGETVKSIELDVRNEAPVFVVESDSRERLLGVIPISVPMKRELSVEGVEQEVERPWWSFLVWR
ncbi:MAG: hypothetical protein HY393_00295 [Candidatus Diapherotrites archaeon]|nr:hypothetical protein [Candidatus Diapherotrites archaeon]